MKSPQSKVLSLDKAFSLIDLIADSPDSLTLNTITKLAGLPKTTVYRLLTCLESWGYVEFNENKGYKLGVKFLQLGAQVQERLDIRNVARPFIKELNSITKETVFLGIMHKGRSLYVDRIDSHYSVRLVSQVGSLNYLHSTALGKCLMSALSEDNVERILTMHGMPALTDRTITDKKTLLNQLETVREKGYAVDDMENEEGVRCVAAPVKDYEGKLVAAISISGPASRVTMEVIENDLKGVLLKTAEEVSIALGYRPG
ncbi:MAG: IclR family transcriptional regulator [Bacillota bacterium]